MTQPVYAPPPPPTPPPSPLPSWARFLGLGCGALLLLATLVGATVMAVVGRASAGPEQAVQAFLAAAGSGDWGAAHAHFSEPLKQVQPFEQFSSIAAANQHLFQVKETTFNNRSVNPAGAELSGSVTLLDGTELPASFKLVKEGGEWRLISYQLGSG
jgi:hypothetical protein